MLGNSFKFRRNFIEITLLHRHITVIKMCSLVNTLMYHYNDIFDERKTKHLIILFHEQVFIRSEVGSLNTTSRRFEQNRKI